MATAVHRPGQEVTLHYGDHPLQHLLAHYSFVPQLAAGGRCSEVFQEFGSSWELLVVQARPQVTSAAPRHAAAATS